MVGLLRVTVARQALHGRFIFLFFKNIAVITNMKFTYVSCSAVQPILKSNRIQ